MGKILCKGASVPAVVTPFKEDGEIDYEIFSDLVAWHVSEGSDGILVHGTTGEAPTITSEEFTNLVKRAKEVIQGQVPLLVGTGTNSTKTTIEKTRIAKELGADMALVVVPYYNLPSDRGCFLHFEKVSKETSLPMMIYYHPGRTGKKLPIDTLLSFLTIPNVHAIKDSSSVDTIEELVKRNPDALIYSGIDETTLEAIDRGASGSISVLANAFPSLWSEMVKNGSYELFESIKEIVEAIFLEVNPVGIKALLHIMGKSPPHVRLPLAELSPSNYEKLLRAFSLVKDMTIPLY